MADAKTTKSSASQIAPTEKPQLPLSLRALLQSYGGSGTANWHGFLETDYNSDLAGITGLIKYNEMRLSDAQVRATLDACELPIRSTEWYVEPTQNEDGQVDDAQKEMADFVAQALFEKMEITWDDYLREVLTMLPFGFSVFEKVFTADDEHVWLKRLASRRQTTIQKWQQDDGTPGITQFLPQPLLEGENKSKFIVNIPASKLLIFSFRKEGDNYAGVSLLRSAFKNWYIKDILYKFDSVRHERESLGIPIIYPPENATPEDKTACLAILENLRANEKNGIVMPGPKEKWNIEYLVNGGTKSAELWKSIEHHNMQISKNVLAMFMDLANTTESGSRALSEDQSDFFLLALEAVAKQIDDVHNRFLIPEIVDLNFNDVKDYPRLKHKKLGSVDYAELSTALSTLASAGIVNPDEDLEDWMRKTMDLPPRVEEEELGIVDEGIDEEGLDLPEDDIPSDGSTPPDETLPPEDQQTLMSELESKLDDDLTDEEEIALCEQILQLAEQWEGQSFRIVSPETRKKISDALKRRKGGGGGGVIAKRRAARMAKYGKKVTDKTEAKIKQGIQKAIADVGSSPSSKMKKGRRSNIGKAVKKIARNAKTKVTRVKTKKATKTPTKRYHEDVGAFAEFMTLVDNAFILRLQREITDPQELARARHLGFKANEYEGKSWRPLTFAERKVNFSSLQNSVKKYEQILGEQIDTITADQKADLLLQVKRAVDNNDIAAVGKIRAKYTGDLAGALTDVQKEMFEIGKKTAATEMKVKVPGTKNEVKGAMRVQNEALVGKLSSDMENAASTAVTQTAAKKGGSITATNTPEALAAATEAIDKVLENVQSLKTLTLIGSLNLGRATIFERYPEQVYGFQYSAIIDDVTTDLCLSLDGRVVKAGSDDFYRYSPPQHYNCRSVWVEILQDEEFKPDLESIPSSIKPNKTIDTAQDLAAPIVKANSPAIRVLQNELEERKTKLEEYQAAGQFPNRQDSHQARIDDLENALKDAGSFSELPVDVTYAGMNEEDQERFFSCIKAILAADGITFTTPEWKPE